MNKSLLKNFRTLNKNKNTDFPLSDKKLNISNNSINLVENMTYFNQVLLFKREFSSKSFNHSNKIKISFYKNSLFEIKYLNQNENKDINKKEKASFIQNIENISTNFIENNSNSVNPKSFYNDIIEEEEEVKFSQNPYLDKNELIKQDKAEREALNHSVNLYIEKLESHHIENMDVNDILEIISKLLKAENNNIDLWYKLLNQFNELLCSHRVFKKDIINLLELLSFFKPKILEKKILPKEMIQIGSENLLSKKHEEEYYRLTQPKDIFGQFALHLKKNLSANVISKFFEFGKKFENRENIDENIDDLLGLYSTLFKNLELKIVDDIANGRTAYNHKEAVILIKSFSCAQEGSNMLYELLMRKIIKNFDELTLSEIEIVLNYLPHELYNNKQINVDSEEKYVEMGRTKSVSEFYNNVYDKVIKNIPKADNQLFLSLCQGCFRIKFVDIDVIGAFLLNFDERLANFEEYYNRKYSSDNCQETVKKEASESVLDNEKKNFIFSFLQILTYFIRNDVDENFLKEIDFEVLWKSLYENFTKKYLDEFTLKEISTLFWIMYHFRSITNDKIEFFEKAINTILIGYINDPKSKIDTMGYETHLRYYDNYKIDPYDVEALKFFVESSVEYKGESISLINKALKCIDLENTHPLSRKLFHF